LPALGTGDPARWARASSPLNAVSTANQNARPINLLEPITTDKFRMATPSAAPNGDAEGIYRACRRTGSPAHRRTGSPVSIHPKANQYANSTACRAR